MKRFRDYWIQFWLHIDLWCFVLMTCLALWLGLSCTTASLLHGFKLDVNSESLIWPMGFWTLPVFVMARWMYRSLLLSGMEETTSQSSVLNGATSSGSGPGSL